MTDIALAVGCSQATVSFVLNHTAGIKLSQGMRERVFEAAHQLGYVLPDSSAATRTKRLPVVAGMIGFAVDQLTTSPEAIVAIEGARQASWATRGIIMVAQTLADPEMEPKTIQALLDAGVSALIYMAIFTREIVAPPILYDLDIPVVLLNCYTADRVFPSVVPSEIAGGQTATRHLLDHGHRRIATITGEPWMDAAKDRLKGYRRALATADIPFDPTLVIEGDWSASSGYAATIQLLALAERPTAIFCQNDRTAIGCFEALKEAGLSIPGDISVVGYDDEEISRHLHPQLTTVILPHRAMGQWAIEHLGSDMDTERRHSLTKLECLLVERQSVAAPLAQL